MKYILGLFTLIVLALTTIRPVSAQDSTPPPRTVTDDQVNAIAKQLYCPVCEGIPLDVCPTKACAQWREQIRDMLAEGKTEQEIKDYFVRLHGVRVLGIPPARGINWLVYIVPPVAILAGAYILYRAFKEWRKPIPTPVNTGTGAELSTGESAEYMSRLEEELRKR